MPAIDFSTARVIGRGRHVAKARRALAQFETVAIDKDVLEALGGHEGLNEILQVLAKSQWTYPADGTHAPCAVAMNRHAHASTTSVRMSNSRRVDRSAARWTKGATVGFAPYPRTRLRGETR